MHAARRGLKVVIAQGQVLELGLGSELRLGSWLVRMATRSAWPRCSVEGSLFSVHAAECWHTTQPLDSLRTVQQERANCHSMQLLAEVEKRFARSTRDWSQCQRHATLGGNTAVVANSEHRRRDDADRPVAQCQSNTSTHDVFWKENSPTCENV